MIWKYYIPAVWESERAVWEDVFLLPNDPEYDGQALWLTIDALGYYEGTERAEAEAQLDHQLYAIDGTDMVVRAESFSKRELLDWVSLWFEENDVEFSGLKEGSIKEFRGRIEQYEALQAGDTAGDLPDEDQVHVHPDTFAVIPADAETGYRRKVFLPRALYAEFEHLPVQEVAQLKEMIRRAANDDTEAGGKFTISASPGN